MEYKTYNYESLVEEIKTKEIADSVAEVISTPHRIVKRCLTLLWDFMEEYMYNPEKGVHELSHFHTNIISKIESIQEQLDMAYKMLDECMNYAANERMIE